MVTGAGARRRESSPGARLRHALTHGNIWLALLSLLKSRKRAYAYELDNLVKHGFGYSPGRVMVYIVLYKLESEGLIRSSFEGRRKYYALTHEGADALASAKRMLASLARTL